MSFIKYIIILLLLYSCLAWSLPSTTSGLNGFEGIRIEYTESNVCKLIFPKGYGLKVEQLQNLVAMSDGVLAHDVGCMAPSAFYSLEQIRRLATDFQSYNAADLILKKSFSNLGVSISEEFMEEYQIPVLRLYKGSKQYIDKNPSYSSRLPSLLANTLCNEWAYETEKVELLVSDLVENGLGELAKAFKNACEAEVSINPTFK